MPRDRRVRPPFDPRSRSVLTHRDLGRFEGEGLFARVARAVCEAGCLPRKELFESWEVARRVRRRVRGRRIVELAAGHAFVAHLLLLLDDTSPTALAADAKRVPSARALADALAARWPRLGGRVEVVVADLTEAPVERGDLVVSVHACRTLSDAVPRGGHARRRSGRGPGPAGAGDPRFRHRRLLRHPGGREGGLHQHDRGRTHHPGHVRLFPARRVVPTVSSINYAAGQTRANNAFVTLNAVGEMAAFVSQAQGTVHLIVDVNG